MINVYVIGCGGIGGYLIDMLPMSIASLSLDIMEKCQYADSTKLLQAAGNQAIPSVVDRITLVDGDVFEPKNAIRQGMGAGTKLVQRMRALHDSMIMRSFLQNLKLVGFNTYVNPSNVTEIIPKVPDRNPDNLEAQNIRMAEHQANASVIFLCVDNIKTRYEISKYAEDFRNVLVINGGNNKTTGHVTVYERSCGVDLDPKIYEVFPDIKPDADKRPDEMACTVVAPKHDQIAVTNSIIANIMLAIFNKWLREGLGEGNSRKNEVIIDTDNLTMMSLFHPKTTARPS